MLSSFKSFLIGHWKTNHSSDFSLPKRTTSQPASRPASQLVGHTDPIMEVAPWPKNHDQKSTKFYNFTINLSNICFYLYGQLLAAQRAWRNQYWKLWMTTLLLQPIRYLDFTPLSRDCELRTQNARKMFKWFMSSTFWDVNLRGWISSNLDHNLRWVFCSTGANEMFQFLGCMLVKLSRTIQYLMLPKKTQYVATSVLTYINLS